jgi:hypothetical protein
VAIGSSAPFSGMDRFELFQFQIYLGFIYIKLTANTCLREILRICCCFVNLLAYRRAVNICFFRAVCLQLLFCVKPLIYSSSSVPDISTSVSVTPSTPVLVCFSFIRYTVWPGAGHLLHSHSGYWHGTLQACVACACMNKEHRLFKIIQCPWKTNKFAFKGRKSSHTSTQLNRFSKHRLDSRIALTNQKEIPLSFL